VKYEKVYYFYKIKSLDVHCTLETFEILLECEKFFPGETNSICIPLYSLFFNLFNSAKLIIEVNHNRGANKKKEKIKGIRKVGVRH